MTRGDSSRGRPAATDGRGREPFDFNLELLKDLEADRDAQEPEWLRVYRHFNPRLRGYLAKRVRDEDDLDELVAIVWKRALAGLPRLGHPGGALKYFLRVADNLIRDEHRNAKRAARKQARIERAAEWEEEERIADAEAGADHPEEAPRPAGISSEELEDVLREFSPRDRDVLKLRLLGGLEHQEIGRQLGISAQAASQCFSRARKVLKQRLIERGKGPPPALGGRP